MSSLRRQTRDSSWQWLSIGVVLGLGCAAVACLAGYAAGVITINFSNGEPAAESLVQPTVLVSEVAELPSPTATQEQQVIIVTATSPALTVLQPTVTPFPTTVSPDQTTATEASAESAAGAAATVIVVGPTQNPALSGTPITTPTPLIEGGVDPVLAAIRTTTELVSGGDFTMGTNQAEVAQAVSVCVNQYGGNCDISFAEDSFPPHQVIVNSFQMERYEVTVGQYVVFLNTLGPNGHLNGCLNQPCAATNVEEPNSNITFDGAIYAVPEIVAQLPMTHVTWYGAQAYCQAIGRRLPTEAEWERAARGPANLIYPYGNEWDPTLANTNRQDFSGQRTDSAPMQVGSFPGGASPFGIEDMAGNVAEWVADWYLPGFYSQPEASGLNPLGPVVGTTKVVRGGSWDTVPFFSRTVHRQEYPPNSQQLFIGFRCVGDDVPVQPASPVQPAGQATAIIPPTQDPNITPTPLATLPPGG